MCTRNNGNQAEIRKDFWRTVRAMGFYNMTHLPNSQVVWTRRGALIYASQVNAYCDGRSERERIEFCHEYPSGELVLFLPLVDPKGESMTEIAFGTPPLPTATPAQPRETQHFPYELLSLQEVMSGVPHELRDEALHSSGSPAELKD